MWGVGESSIHFSTLAEHRLDVFEGGRAERGLLGLSARGSSLPLYCAYRLGHFTSLPVPRSPRVSWSDRALFTRRSRGSRGNVCVELSTTPGTEETLSTCCRHHGILCSRPTASYRDLI